MGRCDGAPCDQWQGLADERLTGRFGANPAEAHLLPRRLGKEHQRVKLLEVTRSIVRVERVDARTLGYLAE